MTPTPDLKAAALAATTLDIERLKRLAEKCMEGDPWYNELSFTPKDIVGLPQDRRFVEAANPATILALIERLQVAEDAAKDAARLNFLIEKHVSVCNDFDADEPTEPTRHWLEYSGVDGSEVWVQMSDHATPREAIDAAIAERRLTP